MSKELKSHSTERSLDEWLCYLESIHATEIDLGLSRISQVAKRLNIDFSFAKVITVAGTNGKGTTCAFIENALLANHHSVAVYSSPHIERFNERLRINKQDVADKPLIDAFRQIEQVRADISLTYYEFTTLAAFLVLMSVKPDFIILEVGLGGRLDATNIINADIGVVTTVDLDHMAFLGNDRETIGFEKAGILRAGKSAVLGEASPPRSVINHANAINADIFQRESDFKVTVHSDGYWQWQDSNVQYTKLVQPFIPLDNVATALKVLWLLEQQFSEQQVNEIIEITKVAGRTELFKNNCDIVLDVGHNPLAARYLSDYLKRQNKNKVYAVVAMLADKDIKSTLAELVDDVDAWYIAGLDVPRGASAKQVAENLPDTCPAVNCFDNVEDAFKMAKTSAKSNDIILVFGSFFTVAKSRKLLA